MGTLQADYAERVYAGVLGKIIGVYLGRPFEGWSYETIMENLGEINFYVHDKLNVPLVVTDDDISGTFTFVRAMKDYQYNRSLSAKEIGRTWLNYLIEERTVLWWGGLGNSTEHTAYLRLKEGIDGPDSGSIALNGQVVAEQIGSQIFIDGWAMISPGNPEQAAYLAREASLVSHDGEAVHGAVMLAAMEAQAFVENDMEKLLDVGMSFIPQDSLIYNMIGDIREWHASDSDWRATRQLIEQKYGYDKYGGNCHMVPNHALVIHALLHGENDFQKSLMIVNTCGWDTDCNSGNVGCLMGIKNGLAGIDSSGPDWREPVADRIYLPTADGGSSITDAVTQSMKLANMGAELAGTELPNFKEGAKFHFSFPGSLQGFQEDQDRETAGITTLRNIRGHSETGDRCLALRFRGMATGKYSRVETSTFIPDYETFDYFNNHGYALLAAPTLYPGQIVRARVEACPHNGVSVMANLYLKYFGEREELQIVRGECIQLDPGAEQIFEWRIPETGANPIAKIGFELCSESTASGYVFLDYLTWDGPPDYEVRTPDVFKRERPRKLSGVMWKYAWVNGIDHYQGWYPETFRLIHNKGRGLLITGTRDWQDYKVSVDITPHMVKAAGVGIHVQGMKRYKAFLLGRDGIARLVSTFDGDEDVLAEAAFPIEFGETYDLEVESDNGHIICSVNGHVLLEADGGHSTLRCGGIALIVEEGRTSTNRVQIRPIA